jgi:hypothetical protein
MDVISCTETFSPANIGKYPVEKKWYEREKIMKRKKSRRKFCTQKTQIVDSGGCLRTKGIWIASGVEDWYFWCKCKRNCFEK